MPGTGLRTAGLDEHQVRRWTSWYRWVTLAMPGAAVLTIAAAIESGHRLRWSHWRRRHQHRTGVT